MVKEFVDASIFLGMQSVDEAVRVACKNYFVDRFSQSIGMSDDQAGKCDRIIWKYSRELQDLYYPFMDRLRTDMDLQSLEYEAEDVAVALGDPRLEGLSMGRKLTLGMAIARSGKLYTIDEKLHQLNSTLSQSEQLPIVHPENGSEKFFRDRILEECYERSLALKIAQID
ncbi:MAG: DUF6190 family protein [Hydrococcus sp. Prado102]|nr:DUF6190 family protein [Hydrococcus sp. Prado102]